MMKQFFHIGIFILLLTALLPTAQAATPEQICQSRKNREAATLVACRHRIASGLPHSSFQLATGNCKSQFKRRWRRVTKRAAAHGSTCLDAPLDSSEVSKVIDQLTVNISLLAGSQQKGSRAQGKCRAVKTVIAGRYAACRYRAESRLARTSDNARYDATISRCEERFEKQWGRIEKITARRGATCFDGHLTIDDYKSSIKEHTDKVAAVLAGVDEFSPISLAAGGSPLALSVNGASGSLTITNTSEKATALNITADFTDTALEGNVFESGNTCSSVAPGASCTLTFTPGSNIVPATDFTVQGSNTETLGVVVSIAAEPFASLSVAGSPLSLTVNGPTGNITITNTHPSLTAMNITSNFSGTALDGNVTETANTCASLAPAASCNLTFTPGNTVVSPTTFTLQGSNTEQAIASIAIQSGSTLTASNPTTGSSSGGTAITLTGTGLTGATGITFGGIAATSVNVVNSTTVTAVAPAAAPGVVDVVIDTPAGGATLANGYTYVVTAVGQAASGGTIACLDGGLDNFIAASADNGTGIEWGGNAISVGAGAQSDIDGASNTAAIVSVLGNGTYAAQLCNDHEVDSQGNSPCQPGNACYNDWFLPAIDQLDCLFTNRVSIGGFSMNLYWSSTETSAFTAWSLRFDSGLALFEDKDILSRVRCIRAFTP